MKIVGDWAPGTKYVEGAMSGDLVLANLEGPVLSRNHSLIAAPKAGPSIYSCELPCGPTNYIFSLANNHSMDYGLPGFEATLTSLRQRNIKYCGAGKTIQESRLPLIVQDNGVTVGIISCCEAQFGVATRSTAGVAEFGSWVYRAISDLSKTVDAVIVSVHAGVEDSPWPSLYIRDLYRSFVDAGATVVHGHHAHVPQGYEKYRNGVIFYGMGNFAVDPDKWKNYTNGMWSLGADIDFSSTSLQYRPITYEIRHKPGSDRIQIEESSREEFEHHQRYLEMCNYPLSDEALFEALWQEVALRAYYAYGGACMNFIGLSDLGRSRLIKEGISKIRNAVLMRNVKDHPDIRRLLLYYHMMACESHRQMLIIALGVLSGEIEDLRTDETCRLADEMVPWSRNGKDRC
jgi:hypothetical protein